MSIDAEMLREEIWQAVCTDRDSSIKAVHFNPSDLEAVQKTLGPVSRQPEGSSLTVFGCAVHTNCMVERGTVMLERVDGSMQPEAIPYLLSEFDKE